MRIGARVRDFKVGDRVALHHHVPCRDCFYCIRHAFAQCLQYKRTGITAGFEPAGGGFAEYVRVMSFVLPGVVRIPARNSFEEGAMLEPVNTVLKGIKRLSLIPNSTVLVAGQGPIGLLFTRLLQIQSVNVVATDLLAQRLKLAHQFGARWTFLANGSVMRKRSDLIQKRNHNSDKALPTGYRLVQKATNGRGLDAAILAVPSNAALHDALQMVRGAGKVLLFAHTQRGVKAILDLASICVDEKDLVGSYSADTTLQEEVARLIFSRRLDIRPLITHYFPLEKAAEAICLAAAPKGNALKIMVGKRGVE